MNEHPSWGELRANIEAMPTSVAEERAEKKLAWEDCQELEMAKNMAEKLSGKIMGIGETMAFLRKFRTENCQ